MSEWSVANTAFKTVLSTDTFVRQNGVWKQVAGHSSVAK